MRKTILLVMGAVCCVFFATAQSEARFTVSVSTDSILLGNYFQVTFSLENAQGDKFEPPAFEDFDVVSGPNTASSFSVVNGKVTQSLSYSYYLEPKDIGNYYILPAAIEVDGKVLETQPLEVMVAPNPDGVKQTPGATQSQGYWPEDFMPAPPVFPSPEIEKPAPEKEQSPKKKKRKVYKL